jgi:hypothetical protein
VVRLLVGRVVANFKDAGEGFNRNLTQLRIGFHSQANCLMAMLLRGVCWQRSSDS